MDPCYGGQNSVLKFMGEKSVFIYKTTPKNTWGSNLFPILRKMEELVAPPPTYVAGGDSLWALAQELSSSKLNR